MSKKPPTKSGAAPGQAREERLKAALKANLGRRKAQARAKAAEGGGAEAGQTGQKSR